MQPCNCGSLHHTAAPHHVHDPTAAGAPGYGLVERAHNEGLQVHPYTFRSDFLPPIYATPSDEILQFAVTIGVDGIFDDLPGFVYNLLTVCHLQRACLCTCLPGIAQLARHLGNFYCKAYKNT